eukprot:1145635-Pelagomonas_calceolata.AAC.2
MLTRGVWQCGECGETFTSNKQFRLHTTCHKRCNDPLQHAPNREQNVSNTNQLGTDDELAAYDEGSQTDDQPLEPPQQFDATQFGTQQSAEESRAKRLRINDAVFIKLCADNKFTQAQTNSILGARANGIELSEVTFKSANDMQDYQINLLPAAERWSSTSIQVKSHVVEFWHRDPVSCIQKLYSDTKHGDGFFYEGDRDAKSEPHGTSVWLDEEDAVRRRLGSDSFIAGVQLYADATVVTLKGRSVHPVYLCLLNHPYSKKILSIDSLAYLPQLEFVESIDPDEDRILKLKLYHKAFRILFTSLRSMKDGVLMTGVDKRRRLVVGILLDFIGDNPEELPAEAKMFLTSIKEDASGDKGRKAYAYHRLHALSKSQKVCSSVESLHYQMGCQLNEEHNLCVTPDTLYNLLLLYFFRFVT